MTPIEIIYDAEGNEAGWRMRRADEPKAPAPKSQDDAAPGGSDGVAKSGEGLPAAAETTEGQHNSGDTTVDAERQGKSTKTVGSSATTRKPRSARAQTKST